MVELKNRKRKKVLTQAIIKILETDSNPNINFEYNKNNTNATKVRKETNGKNMMLLKHMNLIYIWISLSNIIESFEYTPKLKEELSF